MCIKCGDFFEIIIFFWFLGDNADEDTTNAGKESEQKNDLKKIHDNVGDDTTKDNNSEDDFHLSLADDEDEADDDINFNPLNKTNSNVAQATPSLESGTYIIS